MSFVDDRSNGVTFTYRDFLDFHHVRVSRDDDGTLGICLPARYKSMDPFPRLAPRIFQWLFRSNGMDRHDSRD
jgi:hypothetical protein